uniref:Histone deacetylase interacting domain-containing protein n=1 Tax=Oryza glumipatula TaxID=40148 RepID=A0A0E0AU91_9ORYZ
MVVLAQTCHVPAQISTKPRSIKPQTSMRTSVKVHKLTTEDAMNYILTIKNKFLRHPEKFHAFIHTMIDFSRGRINTHTVIERVKILFDGYPDLLLAFNKFLPRGINAI